jgi:DNA-binding NtrC family response regulator
MRPRDSSLKEIVLVSQDKELKRQIHACLSSIGLATGALTMVKDGDEGLAVLTRRRPRLVVLDDSSSDTDGPGLLRAVHQRVPETLVVYLTSHHTAELERAVRQLGVLYYTEKPPDALLFAKVLATVLATTVKTTTEHGTYWRGTWGAY